MQKQIITSVLVSLICAAILAILAKLWGFIPSRSSFVIPSGTVAAFALKDPPDGWEVYEKAKGRFIVGVDYDGHPSYALEQTGGMDASTLLPNVFEAKTASLSAGPSNYLRPNSKISAALDARPPFVSLLICRKK